MVICVDIKKSMLYGADKKGDFIVINQQQRGGMTMTKAELVEKMADDAGISKVAASSALNSFMDGVTKALKKKDGKVTLVGFGTFSKVRRKLVRAVILKQANRLKSKHAMLLSSGLARN